MNQNSRENIYSLVGFKKVFRFTFQQTIKNKSFLILAIVMILMMGLMKPLMYLMDKSNRATSERMSSALSEVKAEKLFILNETDFTIDRDREIPPTNEKIKEGYLDPKNIVVYNKGEAKEEDLLANLESIEILVIIRPEAKTYKVNGIITDSSNVSAGSLDRATEYVQKIFTNARNSEMSLDDAALKSILSGVSHRDVLTAKEYTEEKDFTMPKSEYSGLLMGFCFIVMVVATLSANYIISSVNEEKTSKLAETLLVSVRPMALLLGKVLGMLAFVAGVFVCGVTLSYISEFIMENVMKLDISSLGRGGINMAVFTGYGVKGLVVSLVEIVIALCIFGVLSGILGSACSKTEDQQNAATLVSMLAIIGYAGCFYAGMNSGVSLPGSLVPPFSFFMAPVAYIGGRISLGVLLGSFAIQIAILIGLMMLSAKTYRNLLLSDSSKPQLASIIAAAKN